MVIHEGFPFEVTLEPTTYWLVWLLGQAKKENLTHLCEIMKNILSALLRKTMARNDVSRNAGQEIPLHA